MPIKTTHKNKKPGVANKIPADNSRAKRGAPPTTPRAEYEENNSPAAKMDRKHQKPTALRNDDRKKLLSIAYRFSTRSIDADQVVEQLVALLAKPTTTHSGRVTEVVNPLDSRYNELVHMLSDMTIRLTAMSRDKLPIAKSIVRLRG